MGDVLKLQRGTAVAQNGVCLRAKALNASSGVRQPYRRSTVERKNVKPREFCYWITENSAPRGKVGHP